MEENQDPKELIKKTQRKNNPFSKKYLLGTYINMAIMGITSLIIVFTIYLILIGVFDIQRSYLLAIAFISMLITAPLVNKIKLGYYIQQKYDNLLRKITITIRKWRGFSVPNA